MTNEEKAMELFPDIPALECLCKDVREKLIEMAEWKNNEMKEELARIVNWFSHIEQLANDRKTATGFVMSDTDTLDEIKCLAANSVKYINKYLLNINKL